LRFVGNPESVAFGGEGSDGRQEFTAERVDPALALNGLGDDGYQVFIGGGVQGGDVVGGNEHDAGDEREKGLAYSALAVRARDPSVRPWKPFSRAMIRWRRRLFLFAWARAAFRAASIASEPLLLRKTFAKPVQSTSLAASASW